MKILILLTMLTKKFQAKMMRKIKAFDDGHNNAVKDFLGKALGISKE